MELKKVPWNLNKVPWNLVSLPWPCHGILFKFHGTLLQFKKDKVEPVYSVHNDLSEVSKKVHRVTLQYSSVN